MKKTIGIIIAVITLLAMTYIGKQGYRTAIKYEQSTYELSQQMDAGTLAEFQLKELASLFTLGLVKNDTKEKIIALEKERQVYNKQAKAYAIYFALGAFVILLLYFMLSLQGFTIAISVAALISLINGLITPILLVVIHKEVEYLGDVVLSFESKGIMGSVAKLYANGSLVVAGVILLFSVIVPAIKTLSLLFVAIFEHSSFAAKVVRFFKHLGKWSMIDVFVVAILLVYLTGGSSDTSRVEVEIGLYFFLVYVILSMVASLSADKMLHEKETNSSL
ncbi:MAG TPA: paraquat-inducible protein A [Sulfurovum sp.]|nr:paraquat-inducible protein A [Sulfurovum sp.]